DRGDLRHALHPRALRVSPTRLDGPEAPCAALPSASTPGGAAMLSHVLHRFTPPRVTAPGPSAEFHTPTPLLPEPGYVACDEFTGGDRTDPGRACEELARASGAARHWLRYVARGDEPVRV